MWRIRPWVSSIVNFMKWILFDKMITNIHAIYGHCLQGPHEVAGHI